jgi:hypothetical protein
VLTELDYTHTLFFFFQGRLKLALLKLTHLNRLELNNFVMVKKPFAAKIDTEPFFLFTERQNLKRNIGDTFNF